MIRRTLTYAALLAMLLLSSAAAQESLSLQQAVGLAMKSNPTIAADEFSAAAAKHAARGARALTNPEISISPSVAGAAGADSAVSLVQPLEINGTRRVRGQIAALEAAASTLDAAATRRDIVLRVKQTYWEVARAQELVKLNQENLEYLETLSKVTQKQLDAGAVPGTQLLKAQVEMARARQELAQAQLDLAFEKASLNTLLSRPGNTDFAATDLLVFSDFALDAKALLATAQAQRPELASAQAQLAAAHGRIKAARLLTAPDLSIEARRETFEADSDGGVAVGISLPILDWGSAKSERRQAEAASQGQAKQLEAVRNQVGLEAEQALRQAQTSAAIVREYQGGIVEKSETLAARAQEGYAKGATGYLDVLEAQRTLRATKSQHAGALCEYQKALAQLEWAVGLPIETIRPEEAKQ